MKHGITGIDHPVAAVRDMDGARAAYERLGFIVPPRGRHREWGTGNWCIQFARDYLELRGLIDPNKETHGLDRFLEGGEGMMGVALATVGARTTHDQLAAAGLHPRPAKPLTRDFELPDGSIPVSFVLSFLDPAETPGLMSVVICEHRTPERLRRPEWLEHPNRARRVRGVIGVGSDLDGIAGAWEKLFERVTRGAGELRAELDDGGVLSLLEPDAFARRFPSLPLLPAARQPGLAVASVETADVGATAACLADRGVRHEATDRVVVPPEEACGMALEFAAG